MSQCQSPSTSPFETSSCTHVLWNINELPPINATDVHRIVHLAKQRIDQRIISLYTFGSSQLLDRGRHVRRTLRSYEAVLDEEHDDSPQSCSIRLLTRIVRLLLTAQTLNKSSTTGSASCSERNSLLICANDVELAPCIASLRTSNVFEQIILVATTNCEILGPLAHKSYSYFQVIDRLADEAAHVAALHSQALNDNTLGKVPSSPASSTSSTTSLNSSSSSFVNNDLLPTTPSSRLASLSHGTPPSSSPSTPISSSSLSRLSSKQCSPASNKYGQSRIRIIEPLAPMVKNNESEKEDEPFKFGSLNKLHHGSSLSTTHDEHNAAEFVVTHKSSLLLFFSAVMAWAEKEMLCPRESVIKQQLNGSTTCAVDFELFVHKLVEEGVAVVEGHSPYRIIWPRDKSPCASSSPPAPARFASADFHHPKARFSSEQMQELMSFFVDMRDRRCVISQGRFGFSHFLGESGPLFLRSQPQGILLELTQLLLNQDVLVFKKGRVSFGASTGVPDSIVSSDAGSGSAASGSKANGGESSLGFNPASYEAFPPLSAAVHKTPSSSACVEDASKGHDKKSASPSHKIPTLTTPSDRNFIPASVLPMNAVFDPVALLHSLAMKSRPALETMSPLLPQAWPSHLPVYHFEHGLKVTSTASSGSRNTRRSGSSSSSSAANSAANVTWLAVCTLSLRHPSTSSSLTVLRRYKSTQQRSMSAAKEESARRALEDSIWIFCFDACLVELRDKTKLIKGDEEEQKTIVQEAEIDSMLVLDRFMIYLQQAHVVYHLENAVDFSTAASSSAAGSSSSSSSGLSSVRSFSPYHDENRDYGKKKAPPQGFSGARPKGLESEKAGRALWKCNTMVRFQAAYGEPASSASSSSIVQVQASDGTLVQVPSRPLYATATATNKPLSKAQTAFQLLKQIGLSSSLSSFSSLDPLERFTLDDDEWPPMSRLTCTSSSSPPSSSSSLFSSPAGSNWGETALPQQDSFYPRSHYLASPSPSVGLRCASTPNDAMTPRDLAIGSYGPHQSSFAGGHVGYLTPCSSSTSTSSTVAMMPFSASSSPQHSPYEAQLQPRTLLFEGSSMRLPPHSFSDYVPQQKHRMMSVDSNHALSSSASTSSPAFSQLFPSNLRALSGAPRANAAPFSFRPEAAPFQQANSHYSEEEHLLPLTLLDGDAQDD